MIFNRKLALDKLPKVRELAAEELESLGGGQCDGCHWIVEGDWCALYSQVCDETCYWKGGVKTCLPPVCNCGWDGLCPC